MAKLIHTIQYNVRQGWPLFLKYDIDYFHVPREWLAKHSGVDRRRIYEIEKDKEGDIEELDKLTEAFNLWIKKISEI